jgi:hypothetical protein
MKTILKQTYEYTPGKLIYLALQGSRLYGTFREDSDYDLRGVFLPPLIDLLDSRQKDALSFSLQDENFGHCEITLWSFPFWLRLLHSGDTNATDLYFASTHPNGVWLESHALKQFRSNYAAKDFLPKDLKGMRGYVRSQALKYGAKGKHFQAGQLVLDAALTFNKNNPDTKVRAFWADFVGSSEGRITLRDFADDVRLIKTPDNRDALSVLEKCFISNLRCTSWSLRSRRSSTLMDTVLGQPSRVLIGKPYRIRCVYWMRSLNSTKQDKSSFHSNALSC